MRMVKWRRPMQILWGYHFHLSNGDGYWWQVSFDPPQTGDAGHKT